jgi:hypothetical protein
MDAVFYVRNLRTRHNMVIGAHITWIITLQYLIERFVFWKHVH